MEGLRESSTTANAPPLHTVQLMRRVPFNLVFALVYSVAILALFYLHARNLYYSTSLVSVFITLSLLISDLALAFMWTTAQALHLRQVRRKQFPENLNKVIERNDYPSIDVFICTADPYKEPPVSVVNTALSVMAYDYPREKLSVYVSDDGGSALTLFAFMEAAKFASHWLPFCSKNNIKERNPKAFFESNYYSSPETEIIKTMYECMKGRVENVVERGKVEDEYITSDKEREVFSKWTDKFTRQNHPTVIQVFLDNSKDKDIAGHHLPNLVYLSREKRKVCQHHFKAGALNALIRVSAVMTNAPIILSLDCDTYSNDPQTPERILCYFWDPEVRATCGFIQFPQLFKGLNKTDIYAGQFKRLFQIHPSGFDGLMGGNFYGTGGFFSRRVFFGTPSTMLTPELPQLNPYYVVNKPTQSQEILALAHQVAGCHFEKDTDWGIKKGFRYGSLVEDTYTSYRLHCEGWRSVFCNPERPAFYGEAPISLTDVMNQQRRWVVGLLEMVFSKYSPLTFGLRHNGLMSHGYSQLGFWAIWSIPITIYAFLPQLALLNNLSIFPQVKSPWFLLYAFIFLGAYIQDLIDFVLANGTVHMWWNDQRMWNIRGLSSFMFGFVEFILNSLGISTSGFNVTSKAVDDELSKRYEQGLFEFGVASPMFVPLVMAALMNLVSFAWGLSEIVKGGRNMEGLAIQIFLSAFAVANSWPVYEAMVLRSDNGKMPAKTCVIGTALTWVIYVAGSFILK
ncbi:hypothetical protein P3X46_030189 [Hevea brasiliensis]|uniref:Cellulose synthase-like protein G3 n=1 Tax=Hevea brasiliensis TaxID=3981 RepID=A0ABQ9KXI6_HEVBR|nr:cellulose synthase-like protein G3 [Hevea brasiliensis]KAJ9148095.1 hypothetical protein P3X46_030189 [Hevea brasiliensis]